MSTNIFICHFDFVHRHYLIIQFRIHTSSKAYLILLVIPPHSDNDAVVSLVDKRSNVKTDVNHFVISIIICNFTFRMRKYYFFCCKGK